jgi:hypothetical protein
MNEFERPDDDKERDVPIFSIHRSGMPEDFTEEDLAFAAELHACFSLEDENLPPYYVQTLLDVDDQRFEPVIRGFEYKTSARVFRHLKLRRRLFGAHPSPLNSLSISIGDASLRRSALTMICTFMLIMLLTLAFTGSSFASGIAILLRGTHGNGVYVNKYPVGMVHPSSNQGPEALEPAVKQVSLLTVQQELHFPIYWPGYSLPGYTLQRVNFYVGIDQQWVDGPMLEFEYSHPLSAAELATGIKGDVWVREFKPKADVLQLVGENAADPIEEDTSGMAQAIYVDGQWDANTSGGPSWVYGGRGELIYQIDGVVFWIAGNQLDGVGEKDLMQIAQGLTLCCVMQRVSIADESTPVTQKSEDWYGPFAADVIMVPSDSSGGEGPYYFTVGSSQPPKNVY